MSSRRFIKTSEDWRHQCRLIFWYIINISPLRMKEQRHVPPSWEIFHRKSQSLKGVTPAFQKRWFLSPAPMYLLLMRQYKFNTWPNTMQIPWKWGIEIISVFFHERRKEYSAILYFISGFTSSSWHISFQVMYPWRSNPGFNSPWYLSTFQLSL